jgi:hypothetical protein
VNAHDYYAGYQKWKIPKWLGAVLGGTFTIIAVLSAAMIVKLTRASRPSAPIAAAKAPDPPMLPAAAPAIAAAAPATPVAALAPAPMPPHVRSSHHRSRPKHSVVAKRDSRGHGKSKNDLDRLLGL